MSFFILFIPSCAVPNAYAYLFTDDTSTTEPGHCTVDFWTQYYKDTYFQDGDKSRTRETKLYLYSTYGLTNNWDIGITIPYGFLNYDRTTKTNGFMDIDIETKMRFFEETNLAPSLALYINYITASANEEKSLGSGDQDLWINGIFSKTLNDNLWLDCNLKDITLRAIEALKNVQLIACEDTRHSRILLKAYNITTPLTSYFQHNRFSKTQILLDNLKAGKDIALISDAGMPGVLDPGYYLIQRVIEQDIPITVIPGPSAFLCALGLSGKPIHKFIFEGFLPKKSIARCRRLTELKQLGYTIVFYESCHRIIKTLHDMQRVFGDIPIVVARELTKKFEEIIRLNISLVIEQLGRNKIRGEFVVVI